MKLMVNEGDEGGRCAHNTLPLANTKTPNPRSGQWEVGWEKANRAPILHLPLMSQKNAEEYRIITKMTEGDESL